MAKDAKKDLSEISVEQKLTALYKLQTILSEMDKIKTLRGELPLEVRFGRRNYRSEHSH